MQLVITCSSSSGIGGFFVAKTFLLWAEMICFMLGQVEYESFRFYLLKTLPRGPSLGKHLSIRERNLAPMLVLTFME